MVTHRKTERARRRRNRDRRYRKTRIALWVERYDDGDVMLVGVKTRTGRATMVVTQEHVEDDLAILKPGLLILRRSKFPTKKLTHLQRRAIRKRLKTSRLTRALLLGDWR